MPLPSGPPAELRQDRAQHGIGSGDPEPAEHRGQARTQAYPAHERPPAAGKGADQIGRARVDSAQAHRHRGHGGEVDGDDGQDDARGHALEGDDEYRHQGDWRQGEERDVDAAGETGRDGPEREGDRGGDRDQVAYREPGEHRGERGPDVIAVVTAVGPELDRDLARCRKSARGDQIVLSGEFPEPGQCRQVDRGAPPGRGRIARHGSAVP